MRSTAVIHTAVLVAAGLALAAPALAEPLAACPEGRRADGGCVNPRLAGVARIQAICYSQVKLSYVVCPGVLPAADLRFKFPLQCRDRAPAGTRPALRAAAVLVSVTRLPHIGHFAIG